MLTDWFRALALGVPFSLGIGGAVKGKDGAEDPLGDSKDLDQGPGKLRQARRGPPHDPREHGRRR